MDFSPSDIKDYLAIHFENVEFIEEYDDVIKRFIENGVIIFSSLKENKKVAIKFYSLINILEQENQNKITDINEEYKIARRIPEHNNIIKVFGHNKVRINDKLIGTIMKMEYYPFTLKDIIERRKKFSEDEVLDFLLQMDRALETMHFKLNPAVIHCDIKPSNIGVQIINNKFKYALMDFDVALEIKDYLFSNGLSGITPLYSAPEQLDALKRKQRRITPKVDIYSVGTIAIQMLTGFYPRNTKNRINYTKIFSNIPFKWKKIFWALCENDPQLRPDCIRDILPNKSKKKNLYLLNMFLNNFL